MPQHESEVRRPRPEDALGHHAMKPSSEDREIWEKVLEKLKTKQMPRRHSSSVGRSVSSATSWLREEFARQDRSSNPRLDVSRPALEPGRIQQHDPRSARRRYPSRRRLPRGHGRIRLRQHQRRTESQSLHCSKTISAPLKSQCGGAVRPGEAKRPLRSTTPRPFALI